LKEGYLDAFLEHCRKMVCGGKDATMKHELLSEPDIVKYIIINRLGWAGHVTRMDNNRINTKPVRMRKTGRPKLRWEYVIQDIVTC
jgi:hypothetical protein